MNEDFVTYELAVKLKEKGFNYKCHYCYKNSIIMSHCSEPLNHNADAVTYSAPTISQVLKWLRTKKIVISILPTGYNKETGLPGYYYVVYDVTEYFWEKFEYPGSFDTWEECELSAIEYILDNLI